MSDNGYEDDLSRLLDIKEDDIKPIDADDDLARLGTAMPLDREDKPRVPAVPPSLEEAAPAPEAPPVPPLDAGPRKDPSAGAVPDSETILDDLEKKPKYKDIESIAGEGANIVGKGAFYDLTEKKSYLKQISIGVGWDQRAFEEKPIDVDVSIFLLNKEDETRIDEDFIFYNNESALDGAVRHLGDNRTGAGAGDDENVYIDINGVPFDILKIMIVLSIYDTEMKGHNFTMVKNVFIRVIDEDDRSELVRFPIMDDDLEICTGIRAAALVREGPKWYFQTLAEPVKGGLGKIASEYGIIVQEMESTGAAEI